MDYAKLDQLLRTDAALAAGVPSMNDVTAASWCNGNQPAEGGSLLLCYVDIQVSNLSQYAGFERAVRGSLARALEKHRLGYGESPKVDQLSDNDWRNTDLLLAAMNAAERAMWCLRTSDQQQHGNLDSLLQSLVDAGVIGAGDKQFIMDMANKDMRPCDLDPATVDNNPWERVAENWIAPFTEIGPDHVTRSRALFGR